MSFYGFARRCLSRPIRGMFRIRFEGSENMPAGGPVILCSNHRSDIDPVLLAAVLPRNMFFMAKASLFKIPLFNLLIRSLGAFPVRRGAGDREAIRRALDIVRRGDVLAMFPEGHRRKEGGEPLRFQSGAARIAAQTGAVILPAAILCEGRVWPHKPKFIRIGKPLAPEQLGLGGGAEAMRQASERIREAVMALMEEKA